MSGPKRRQTEGSVYLRGEAKEKASSLEVKTRALEGGALR